MPTLFDSICFFSILGIYPRFIEPTLIKTERFSVRTKHKSLKGLKIVQLSDLHIGSSTSKKFLKKIIRKTLELEPDLIVFTGDFIQYGQVDNIEMLRNFFSSFKAPLGCFAVLGNHDYSKYIGISKDRSYGVKTSVPPIIQLKNRLTKKQKKPNASFDFSLKGVQANPTLKALFQECSINLLQNKGLHLTPDLHIHGTGEYWAADCDPSTFEETEAFSLLLIHNPDGFKFFKSKKIDLALSGHVHNGQINLPMIRDLFLLSEDGYLSGLYENLYVSRGLGGTLPLRMRAVPEITLIELTA